METKPTHSAQIYEWLTQNPSRTLQIAYHVIKDLYLAEGRTMVVGSNDDFPSGADYIDEVCGTLQQYGITDLLETLATETDLLEQEEEEA